MIQRLVALRAKHGILEAKIKREELRPRPDTLRLMALKRFRLRLRDKIYKLEQALERTHPKPSAA